MPRRLLAIAAAVTIGTTLWAASPSFAGDTVDPSIAITPTQGPPGTAITVTGDDCTTDGDTEVVVSLFTPDGESRPDQAVAPTTDGAWTAVVTVPADTVLYGDWHVGAICQIPVPEVDLQAQQSNELFEYQDEDFTVLAPAADPEPTPAAPQPAPVPADVDFTG